jgi:hypothetical protein
VICECWVYPGYPLNHVIARHQAAQREARTAWCGVRRVLSDDVMHRATALAKHKVGSTPVLRSQELGLRRGGRLVKDEERRWGSEDPFPREVAPRITGAHERGASLHAERGRASLRSGVMLRGREAPGLGDRVPPGPPNCAVRSSWMRRRATPIRERRSMVSRLTVRSTRVGMYPPCVGGCPARRRKGLRRIMP